MHDTCSYILLLYLMIKIQPTFYNYACTCKGLSWWAVDNVPPHRSGVYMIDLNSDIPKLVNLTFEGPYRESISPDFTPHGMGHWVTKDREMILYIINHRREGDTVDSFVYNPTKKSLKY